MNNNENMQKFVCEPCDYNTAKKSNMDNHLKCKKHLTKTNNNTSTNNTPQPPPCNKYICQNCDKEFNDNSGLWRHKKKCVAPAVNTIIEEKIEESSDSDDDEEDFSNKTPDEIIALLIKENSSFKQLIIDQQSQLIELKRGNEILQKLCIEIIQKFIEMDKERIEMDRERDEKEKEDKY